MKNKTLLIILLSVLVVVIVAAFLYWKYGSISADVNTVPSNTTAPSNISELKISSTNQLVSTEGLTGESQVAPASVPTLPTGCNISEYNALTTSANSTLNQLKALTGDLEWTGSTGIIEAAKKQMGTVVSAQPQKFTDALYQIYKARSASKYEPTLKNKFVGVANPSSLTFCSQLSSNSTQGTTSKVYSTTGVGGMTALVIVKYNPAAVLGSYGSLQPVMTNKYLYSVFTDPMNIFVFVGRNLDKNNPYAGTRSYTASYYQFFTTIKFQQF